MAEAVTQWKLVQPLGLLGAPMSDLGEVEPGDLVMCGYFCDNLGGGPAGARFLARQIRYFSESADALRGVHDLGDLNVFPLEPEKHEAAIFRQLDKIAAAGGIPILVGGDGSGLGILEQHVAWRFDRRAIVCRLGLSESHRQEGAPAILALDLSEWPLPGMERVGASYDLCRLLDRLDDLPVTAAGVAIFGHAPALDWSGAAETRLARDLLASVVARLTKGRLDAAS
jgi:hypothetical protein